MLKLAKLHRITGYTIALASQFTLCTGILHAYTYFFEKSTGQILAAIVIGVYFLLLTAAEIRYQILLRRETPFPGTNESMTQVEFEKQVSEGE